MWVGCLVSRPSGRECLVGTSGEGLRHAVQLHALAAVDGSAVVVVGPWGKLEQSTTGTGVEGSSYRLVKFREAILHEVNEWTLLFMCLMGYGLLRFGDEGSDEYRTACGGRAAVVSICGGLLLCPASATVDGQQRVPQKVEVSDGVEWYARNVYAAVDDEVLAALLLDEQAAWVIAHVGHDVWQLAAAGENAVVVSALEEGRGGGRPEGRLA